MGVPRETSRQWLTQAQGHRGTMETPQPWASGDRLGTTIPNALKHSATFARISCGGGVSVCVHMCTCLCIFICM